MKVSCVPAGGGVSIYTLSGEFVCLVAEAGGMVHWDGRNRYGVPVSPGAYYFVVQRGQSVLHKGKFLVTDGR